MNRYLILIFFLVGCDSKINNNLENKKSYESFNVTPENKWVNTFALQGFYSDNLKPLDLKDKDFFHIKLHSDKYNINVDSQFQPNFIYLFSLGVKKNVNYIEIFRDRQVEKNPVMLSYVLNFNESNFYAINNKEIIEIISNLTKVSIFKINGFFFDYLKQNINNTNNTELFVKRYFYNELVFEFATDPVDRKLSILYIYKK